MKRVTEQQFASSALWKLLEAVAEKGVSLVLSLVLARLLLPEYFGLISLTMVCISFSDIFIQSGFNIALIRKESVTAVDYSTVLCLSLGIATVFYIIFFVTAPYIAAYYDEAEICMVLRAIAIVLFFQAGSTVIRAKATREMQFKQMSIVACSSGAIAGIVGIIMACSGCGIWSLVAQQILYYACDTIILTIVIKWKYSFVFSAVAAKQISKFSFGVFGSALLDFAGNNVASLIIGKIYSTEDLAYISRGKVLPEQICLYTFNAVNSVILPTFAIRQDSREQMKAVARQIISMTTFIIFPMMGGLAIVGPRLIPFLLTDKWNMSIPILQWYCVYYICNPIRSINYNIFYAMGKSNVTLFIEIIRCGLLLGVAVVVLGIFHYNIYVYACCCAIMAVVVAVITQFWCRKCIGYTFKEFFKDIIPAFLLTASMCVLTYLVSFLDIDDVVLLFAQILVGIAYYVGLSAILRLKDFQRILRLAKSLLNSRKAQKA